MHALSFVIFEPVLLLFGKKVTAAPSNRPQGRVTVSHRAMDGGRIRIEVSDTGPGFRPNASPGFSPRSIGWERNGSARIEPVSGSGCRNI
ncbi:ATP-binding protein [Rhizobium leguminosarum]|uniref:Histidine kinase/HSP90-like ATPase domain-containing protein n=1 Tax=Rhizobium leguminosarum bv. trifolii (strain WSM1325) TaxID=395491 RepID=C6B4F2_RHILS|nr:ATP-binding protein [Rhizobium leguminosarum]ACS58960.1 hypothetical protein Rleg_4729 [Rhizobium leguminosarum bv. trifolii WSM1325]